MIPVAEKAIELNSPEPLIGFLTRQVQVEVADRLGAMLRAKQHASEGVDAGRKYVEAMLGLQVWSHKLYGCIKGAAHEGHHQH